MIKMRMLDALVRNPKVSAKTGNKMNAGVIAPYQKAMRETKADGK